MEKRNTNRQREHRDEYRQHSPAWIRAQRRKRKRIIRRRIMIGGAVICVVLIAGVVGLSAIGQKAMEAYSAQTLTTTALERKDLTNTISLTGNIQSASTRKVYLEASGASMEELRAHAREQAVSAARFELAMTEIARLEGIDVTDAEVEQKYNELSAQYQLSADLLRQQLPPMRLRHDLKLARAQAVIVDTARRK